MESTIARVLTETQVKEMLSKHFKQKDRSPKKTIHIYTNICVLYFDGPFQDSEERVVINNDEFEDIIKQQYLILGYQADHENYEIVTVKKKMSYLDEFKHLELTFKPKKQEVVGGLSVSEEHKGNLSVVDLFSKPESKQTKKPWWKLW